MRVVALIFSALVLVPAIAFFVLVATGPGTASGFGYASAVLLLAMSTAPADARVRRRLLGGSAALLCTTVVLRVALVGHGRTLTMQTPSTTSARWVDRVLDEEDLSVNAARALAWTGFLRDPDIPVLADAMRGAYGRMRTAQGSTPSPVVATYLGLEGVGEDDTIEVGDVAGSQGVLVFLHGFAGSFTLPCWVVSEAASRAGFATVCPSTRWVGDWWTPEGEATARESLAILRKRGAKRVVLAGLSNGGVGASLLGPRLRGSIDGLVVISGALADADPPGVPVLAIQGESDSQIAASVVHAYARRVGARYVPLSAGHFAMLVREEEAMTALTTFLLERGGRGPERTRTRARASRPHD